MRQYYEGQIHYTNSGEEFVINKCYGKSKFNITFTSTGRTIDTGKLCHVKNGQYVKDHNKAYIKYEAGQVHTTNAGHEFKILDIFNREDLGRLRTKYRIQFTETGRIVIAGNINCVKLGHYSPFKATNSSKL